MPRLNGRRSTRAPFTCATAAVRSADPSSMTTTSMPGSNARSSSITCGTVCSSLNAGTIATRRNSVRPGSEAAGTSVTVASDTGAHGHPEAEKVEHTTRAMRVRVLVEDALARPAAELFRLAGVGEQLLVRGDRLVRIGDDAQLVEPPLDARDRVGDDRGPGRRQLEQPAGG